MRRSCFRILALAALVFVAAGERLRGLLGCGGGIWADAPPAASCRSGFAAACVARQQHASARLALWHAPAGPLAEARRLRAKVAARRIVGESATDLSITPRDDAIEFAKIENSFAPKQVARHTPSLMLHRSSTAVGARECDGLDCNDNDQRSNQGPADDDEDEQSDSTSENGRYNNEDEDEDEDEDEEQTSPSASVGVEDDDEDNHE